MGCSSCGGGVVSFNANIRGFSSKRMKTIKNRLSDSLAKKNVQKSNRNQKPNRIVKSKGFSKGFKMSYKR